MFLISRIIIILCLSLSELLNLKAHTQLQKPSHVVLLSLYIHKRAAKL